MIESPVTPYEIKRAEYRIIQSKHVPQKKTVCHTIENVINVVPLKIWKNLSLNTSLQCPSCNSRYWMLFKYDYGDGNVGLRYRCATCGCVDMVTDVLHFVWELIENERRYIHNKEIDLRGRASR